MSRATTLAGSAALAVTAWTATRAAQHRLDAAPPGGPSRWQRTNHRGETVSLLAGPAAALGTAAAVALTPVPVAARAAGVLASVGAGGFGVLDDLAERRSAKGLRGHLGALRRGEVTTGLVKMAGIGGVGLATAALARRGAGGEVAGPRGAVAGVAGLAASGATVAVTANLANLFDLRPGRALKVCLLGAVPLLGGRGGALAGAVAGASVALLPDDLGERTMLGDGGANALGALLGIAAVTGLAPRRRAVVLAGGLALMLASEKVSFTRVIESTPGLRELDRLGRRPR